MVRKNCWQELSIYRMNNCFDHFKEMQYRLQKGAILYIIRHWKKFVLRRREARRIAEEEEKARLALKKKKSSKANATQGTANNRQKSVKQTAPLSKNGSQKGAAPAKSTNSKNSQKSDNAFMTGLQKADSANSSKKSLNQKSQESLHKNASQTDKTGQTVTVSQAEKLDLTGNEVV